MKRWLCCALFSWTVFAAGEIISTGVKLPLLDASGRITRRLSGDFSGSLEAPRVRSGIVDFFDPEKASAPLAQLFLDEAVYAKAESMIVGLGEVRFRSPDGNLTGQGYRYDIDRDRITIAAGFHIELPDSVIEGREADVVLGRRNGEVIVQALEAKGDVVVIPKHPEKFGFERAYTERAWYAATDATLRLASPIRKVHKGQEALATGEFSYKFDLQR